MTDIESMPDARGASATGAQPRRNILDLTSQAMMAISCMALFAMVVIVTIEVTSRYFLHAPTIWAWDVNVQLMTLMVMFGLAEVYRRDDYVRVDVVTSLLSPRNRVLLDVLFAPLLLFIVAIVVWMSWRYFQHSWIRNQHASTIFGPPLWPIKASLPIGFALLFVHGVLKLIRDIRLLRSPALAPSARTETGS